MEKDFKIIWLDVKSPDWKVATLEDEQTQYSEVSINKVNKKGEVFPNFDAIQKGGTIRGNLWTSSGGKKYLFAPKPQKSQNFRNDMKSVMKEKQENVKEAQETKKENIKEAAAQRDAVLMVTTFYPEFANDPLLSSEKEKLLKEKYLQWRDFFLNQPPIADKQL